MARLASVAASAVALPGRMTFVTKPDLAPSHSNEVHEDLARRAERGRRKQRPRGPIRNINLPGFAYQRLGSGFWMVFNPCINSKGGRPYGRTDIPSTSEPLHIISLLQVHDYTL